MAIIERLGKKYNEALLKAMLGMPKIEDIKNTKKNECLVSKASRKNE